MSAEEGGGIYVAADMIKDNYGNEFCEMKENNIPINFDRDGARFNRNTGEIFFVQGHDQNYPCKEGIYVLKDGYLEEKKTITYQLKTIDLDKGKTKDCYWVNDKQAKRAEYNRAKKEMESKSQGDGWIDLPLDMESETVEDALEEYKNRRGGYQE